uniref:Protein takeout n=1 Tax=Timema bartmani TaxID=61472 RepID=A0A7R9F3X1_9NEOP|nr:unnamed protein product [Timema bartmani]
MTSARNRAIPVEWPMSVGEDSADLCGYMISCDQHNEPSCSSYIRPCSRIDPNIDACALESARLAIPHVINVELLGSELKGLLVELKDRDVVESDEMAAGESDEMAAGESNERTFGDSLDGDRKYRIPPLEPLVISELRVDQDSGSRAIGFSFVAKNASLRGMSGVEVNHIRWVSSERCGAKVNVKYIFKFGIEQRADGKNYTSPEEPRLEFDIGGRAYIHLKNLFNGDKLLGDQMNIFLNENWEILVKEVGPTIGEAIGEAMRQILAGIFDLVPLEDAFPLDAGTATPKKD